MLVKKMAKKEANPISRRGKTQCIAKQFLESLTLEVAPAEIFCNKNVDF